MKNVMLMITISGAAISTGRLSIQLNLSVSQMLKNQLLVSITYTAKASGDAVFSTCLAFWDLTLVLVASTNRQIELTTT